MTRINTNISSLNAQKTLARSNDQLQEALTRLSTGLRINVGKDDPAGLIASEILRSDMVSTEKAITNSERANQMIATADSALGQVSSLLNDIRGLVEEAANKGALSADQIAANQLQVDSSLEAIDRISQTTQFQGKRLLDGSLDFITQNVNSSQLTSLQIDQANFGTLSEIPVTVEVAQQATKGELRFLSSSVTQDTVLELSGKEGAQAFSFAAGSTILEMAAAINLVSDATGVRAQVASGSTAGAMTVATPGADNDMILTAKQAGFAAGNVRVKYTEGNTTETTATYTAGTTASDPGLIVVGLRKTDGVQATGTTNDDDLMSQATKTLTPAANGGITFTAVNAGASGNDLKITTVTGVAAGSEVVTFNDINKTMTIQLNAASTADQVIAAVNASSAAQYITAARQTGHSGAGAFGGTLYTAQALSGGTGDVNNDMVITARQAGTAFNAKSVQIVSGNATAKGISSLNRRASFTTTTGVANGELTFTAKQGGEAGNAVKIKFTTDANASTVSVTGNTITIKTDNAGTTAAAVKTLIDNNSAASALIDVAYATGNDGSGDIAAGANAYLNDGIVLDNGHLATATKAFGAAGDAKMVFRSKISGPEGDGISIVFTEDTNAATVTVSGKTITVKSNTAAPSHVDDIVALIRANAQASALVEVGIEGDALATTSTASATGTTTLTRADATHKNGLQAEVVEYAAEAKAARMSVTWGTTGNTNYDFTISATQAGTAYNDVSLVIQTDATMAAGAARAEYSTASGSKVLTLTLSTGNGGTTVSMANIRDAIESVTDGTGTQLFSVANDDSANGGVTDWDTNVMTVADLTPGQSYGDTANTGGAAGTLFVYVEEGVSTANDVMSQLSAVKSAGTGDNDDDNLTARAAQLFTIAKAGNNDGTGKLFAKSFSGLLTGGVNAGIVATSQEVVNAINNSTTAGAVLTAALGAGNLGTGVMAAFQESALYGDVANNNRLRFLGGENSPSIRFVAGAAGSALSIQDSRTQATMVKDSAAANSALNFTAKNVGATYDGVRVVFVDDANVTAGNEIVTYNEKTKTLKFQIDGGNTTAANISTALANDDIAGNLFAAANYGTSDGSGVVDVDLKQASVEISTGAGNTEKFTVTANAYGTVGNSYTVDLNLAGTPGVTFSGGVLTINVAAGTTVDEVVGLINNSVGADFTAAVTAISATPAAVTAEDATLAGGVGTDSNGDGTPDPQTTDTMTSGGQGGPMVVNLATDALGSVTTTANDLIAYMESSANAALVSNFGLSVANSEGSVGTGLLAATTTDLDMATLGISYYDVAATGTSTAVNGLNARITVTADQLGTGLGGVRVVFQNDGTIVAGDESASYDAEAKVLTVRVRSGESSADQVIAAINDDVGNLFTATEATGGDGTGKVTSSDTLTLSSGQGVNGTAQGATLLGNSDAATTGMTLNASEFGADYFVSVKTISGTFATVDSTGASATRNSGSDLQASVNGIRAVGKGLGGSITTSTLQMSFKVASTMVAGQSTTFSITGGGAQFQLGPQVVSNQQARIGIGSVNSASLGGTTGGLYELRSGGDKSLTGDLIGAGHVITEVISKVATLRGRLGAFQKTTLDTNIASLSDTLENLTAAESSIRDADFAAESANMTRAQILTQSGLAVLSIANQRPQQVLSLLRG